MPEREFRIKLKLIPDNFVFLGFAVRNVIEATRVSRQFIWFYLAVRRSYAQILSGYNFIRSTTLITLIFRSGKCFRRIETAANISSVGVSRRHDITTSGSTPRSLLGSDEYKNDLHGEMRVFPCLLNLRVNGRAQFLLSFT